MTMRPIAALLAEANASNRKTISVEFFPPKTAEGETRLRRTIEDLNRSPVPIDFVSVTYGAGGTTRDRTRDLVVELNSSGRYPAMAHLTCVGHTKDELHDLLADYASVGVNNILALGGDPPADGSPVTGDFIYAQELVDLIRSHPATSDTVSIGVAAHPEMHPRSTDRNLDRRRLAEKLVQADFAITQFFYDPTDYFTMIDEVVAASRGESTKPVLPGIMPLTNPDGVKRMADMSHASFPTEHAERITAATDDDVRHQLIVDHAVELCSTMLQGGAPGLHLYGLNRSETVLAIIRELAERGLLS